MWQKMPWTGLFLAVVVQRLLHAVHASLEHCEKIPRGGLPKDGYLLCTRPPVIGINPEGHRQERLCKLTTHTVGKEREGVVHRREAQGRGCGRG